MSFLNEPKWIDVDVKGEITGQRYTGRFLIKPFLTHEENADASKLAGLYCRGIESEQLYNFMYGLALLKFYVVDSDAKWWKESDAGLKAIDQSPFNAIGLELDKVRDSLRPAETEEKK